MVQRTYGAMTNDVLISIPLFVLMGYVMERGALVDKMFYSIQLAFRRVPASLAVATLIVCTFWGIASGLVGAVVVLMGVIAFNPMLRAGYDVKLASGVITAGGTLGILIPPSVMIIVYAAVAGQSVVKLYAAAMFPGFFLAFLYLVYIVGWAMINPKIAPPLPEEQTQVPVPALDARNSRQAYSPQHLRRARQGAAVAVEGALAIETDKGRVSYWMLLKNFVYALVPFLIVARHAGASGGTSSSIQQAGAEAVVVEGVQQLGTPGLAQGADARRAGAAGSFYFWFWRHRGRPARSGRSATTGGSTPSGFEVIKLLSSSIDAARHSHRRRARRDPVRHHDRDGSAGVGAAGAFLLALQARTLDWKRTKEAVFLTAKTTAMVCWLFVGSALFSGVFAILGGQALVEQWVLSLNMSPIQFMILSQAIIFVLGWPLEWTEIIVIFVPIFLPLLKHFNIDPILWGMLVFVNLQAAFLSPPVAMSAFYLKGVAPKHVTLNQIFAGMMPYMLIVIVCMVFMYIWPGMTLWLPNYLYGN